MTAADIPAAEFHDRQRRAAESARGQGLAGLLVCSRGGGTVDRYANVLYLANFYSSFPFIPDVKGNWSARAHSFVVLPSDGDPVLVTDMPVKPDEVRVGDVRTADEVVPEVARAIRDRGLGNATLGVAGADALPWSVFRGLQAMLPGVTFVPADHVLDRLRMIKSLAEIALLRRAAELGGQAIEVMMAAAAPGKTQGEVMGEGLRAMAAHGVMLYNSFMGSGRGGNRPHIKYTDFPTFGSAEPIEDGEWFHVGLSGVYRGYYFDHSRSKPIGNPTAPQVEAFEAAIASVQAAIARIRPGATAGEVAEAGFAKLVELGFPTKSEFNGMGHGVGMGWDLPWLVPGDQTVIEPNMVLCVERSVEKHGYVGDFEETVLVTPRGHELLTHTQIRRW
ncbi:MAG: aminopeptidase P family protein [Alphaproteobacteria bacterium]|nr:aminopeptidase P family protein [Alphaproteobacteria bacterium]